MTPRFQMRRLALLAALVAVSGGLLPVSARAAPGSGSTIALTGRIRLLKVRGEAGSGSKKYNPEMTYHGGGILASVVTQSIYWGPSWNNAAFVGDKISGLDSFYSGFSSSNYAKTSDEYTGTNGQVGPAVAYRGHIIDPSAAQGGNATAAILAEVAKEITAPVSNGYYPVYTDLPRGHANYCGWHSSGTINGVPVQFAFFWNLDGDPGCDPQDASGLHSQGVAALANVSAHELSEARTDPAGASWYDSSGNENGDKCSWTFNVPLVTLSNGTQWKLQGEWSNNAYNTNTGYPNSLGQHGCLDGQ